MSPDKQDYNVLGLILRPPACINLLPFLAYNKGGTMTITA